MLFPCADLQVQAISHPIEIYYLLFLERGDRLPNLRIGDLFEGKQTAAQDRDPGIHPAVIVNIDDQTIIEHLFEKRQAINALAGADGLF